MSLPALIQGCLEKNTKAQEQLYQLYASKLFSVCLKYSRNYAEAEDNLQDGFLIIFDKICASGRVRRLRTDLRIQPGHHCWQTQGVVPQCAGGGEIGLSEGSGMARLASLPAE